MTIIRDFFGYEYESGLLEVWGIGKQCYETTEFDYFAINPNQLRDLLDEYKERGLIVQFKTDDIEEIYEMAANNQLTQID